MNDCLKQQPYVFASVASLKLAWLSVGKIDMMEEHKCLCIVHIRESILVLTPFSADV